MKKKKALRASAQVLAETVIGPRAGAFEDCLGADGAWLRGVCGLPFYEAKALVKFLQACPYREAVAEAAASEGEELEASPEKELDGTTEVEL